jgi:hypothetical protein
MASVVSAVLFPSPARVAEATRDGVVDGTLTMQVGISLARVFAGLATATLLAVSLAVLLCLRPRLVRPVWPHRRSRGASGPMLACSFGTAQRRRVSAPCSRSRG